MALAIGAGLVLLIAFTAFVLRLAENAVRREAEARVRSTAELSARLVGEQSLRFEEVVTSYADRLASVQAPRRAQLSARDRRLVQRDLADMAANVEGIVSVAFTDRIGRLVAVAPRGQLPIGLDLSGRDWFKGVTRGGSAYLSRAYRSAGRDRAKITVAAVLVKNPEGRPLGLIAATEARRTQRFTDTYGREVRASVMVTDQSGTVVGQTNRNSNRLVSRRADPLVTAALAGHSGVRVRDVDGERTVSGYAPVPRTGWTVIADVPAKDAFADIPRLRTTLLLGTGVVAFVLLWMVPLLAGRLGRAREALGVSEAFQRDLIGSVLPDGVRRHYVASERRMLLGGDFLDAVRTPDGGLAVCIGDVCGHGPRPAALGATLRAGWRTMASAGVPVSRMDLLDRLVESERPDEDLFATMACAYVPLEGDRVDYALAGHPPIVLADRGELLTLQEARGPALGLAAGLEWPVGGRALHPGWSLALFTDGLIEARTTNDAPRLGIEGLLALLARHMHGGRLDSEGVLAGVSAVAEGRTEGLDDDLALILVDGAGVSLDSGGDTAAPVAGYGEASFPGPHPPEA